MQLVHVVNLVEAQGKWDGDPIRGGVVGDKEMVKLCKKQRIVIA